MVPLKHNDVVKLLPMINIKLKRMQRNKSLDPSLIMSLRLFIVGLARLMQYFRSLENPDPEAKGYRTKVLFRFYDFKYWAETAKADTKIPMARLLDRRRYQNLSMLFLNLKEANKTLTPETEKIFLLMTIVFVIELYSLMMFFCTANLDPTFLRGNAPKKAVKTMLAFRKKATLPINYYTALKNDPTDIVTNTKVEKALANMLPFLGKNLRALITFNKRLVQ